MSYRAIRQSGLHFGRTRPVASSNAPVRVPILGGELGTKWTDLDQSDLARKALVQSQFGTRPQESGLYVVWVLRAQLNAFFPA